MSGNKYGAVRTTIDGVTFHSKSEARHYAELRLRERAGEIRALELQPKFPFVVNGVKICTYIADFRYTDTKTGRVVVTDVKGVKTLTYLKNKRLLKALYGIDILEVPA